MAKLNVRCKRDYEDLGNNEGSSMESVERNPNILALRAQPSFYQSDSAINVSPANVSPLKNPGMHKYQRDFSGSIPCFLRQSSFTSQRESPPQRNSKQSTQNTGVHNTRRQRNFWFFGYICLYVTYLVMGSFCIKIIEAPIERTLRKNYTNVRDNILKKYPYITEDLEEFVQLVIAANDIGISILEDFQNVTSWNFGQSLFFSTSLVTTIGYGHITPKSQLGKVFCIVFAAIGIPLTLVLLTAIVERLLIPTNSLLNALISKLSYSHTIFGIRLIHLFIIGSFLFVLFFAIPMAILLYLEDTWTALDAFYFCFISLTTIGLGDFIPGETSHNEYNSLYKVIFSIYMIIGLVGMMLILTVFYNIPQLNIGLLIANENHHEEIEETSKPPKEFERTSSLPS